MRREKEEEAGITVFLMADAVAAARQSQKTLDDYYNIERMLKRLIAGKATVLICGTYTNARGLREEDLMQGARRRSMDELAAAVAVADRVLIF